MVLAWIVFALGVALLYLAITPALYTATVTLLTDTKRTPPAPTEYSPESSVDTAVVDTQVELIRSDRIALAAIDKLTLIDDPEFNGEGGSSWFGWLFSGSGTGLLSSDELHRQTALANFKRALRVVRVGRSYVTEISFTSRDPAKAAAAANTLAYAYIADQLSAKIEITQRASEWMGQRTKELHKKTADAARALEELKAHNSANVGPSGGAGGGRELDELSAALTKARADETLLNRLSQIVQQQSFIVPEARVLGEAAPPLRKSSPRTQLIILLALLTGGAMGLTTAVTREHLDNFVRTPAQFPHELVLRALGVVPIAEPAAVRLFSTRRNRGPLLLIAKASAGARRSSRAIALATETLNAVRVAITQSVRRETGTVIGFVSVLPGEGKTTLAYNLALLAAQGRRRTLLIDGNLHEPTLTRYLAAENPKRLLAVLSKEVDLAQGVIEIDGLAFLGEASEDTATYAVDLLGAPAMENLLDTARRTYDYVVVDLPGMLHHVDAAAIAHAVDAFVLVAEWGRTSLRDIKEVIGSSDAVAERLVGAVINKHKTRGRRTLA
jgi:polysaccharide biosynthesis transport protein